MACRPIHNFIKHVFGRHGKDGGQLHSSIGCTKSLKLHASFYFIFTLYFHHHESYLKLIKCGMTSWCFKYASRALRFCTLFLCPGEVERSIFRIPIVERHRLPSEIFTPNYIMTNQEHLFFFD